MRLENIAWKPEGTARPSPILFVHGMWHAAWCWEKFQPYFAAHGYESHAMSLRGHGYSDGQDRIRWYSAAKDYVADLDRMAREMEHPPILVGHSMGGYVIQKYLETHTAPAAILLATIPVSGLGGAAVRFLRKSPAQLIKYALFLDPLRLIDDPKLAKEMLFSPTLSDAEFNQYYKHLQQDSFLATMEALLFRLPRPRKAKTPMLILAGGKDRIFSVKEAQATARAYHTQAVVFPNMAHEMMLDPEWQKVADEMLGWLNQRGL